MKRVSHAFKHQAPEQLGLIQTPAHQYPGREESGGESKRKGLQWDYAGAPTASNNGGWCQSFV